jgi:hypothetical protein
VLFVSTVIAVTACLGTLAAGAQPAIEDAFAKKEATGPGRPLATAVLDPDSFGDAESKTAYEHLRRAGARFVRVMMNWVDVAPDGSTKPASFQPRDPGDPLYDWASIDRQVRQAKSSGIEPFVYVQTAPRWAQGDACTKDDGACRPSPSALADFMTAAGRRYAGGYRRLPRVWYWQIWNEPNLNIDLAPQSVSGDHVSPSWYRDMVNSAAHALHVVHRDSVVIAGGLAPFGSDSNDGGAGPNHQERIRPLEFMRQMLCMSDDAHPVATCNGTSEFDAWAHNPYTYGGPTHHAINPDDVSIGDLGDMRRLLRAAEAAGHIRSRQSVDFWVTEFSYDAKPADPNGLPPALHARWTAEALYRMWRQGVTHVTWFLLRDEPFPSQMFQSGLYYRGPNGIASDKPKLALRAFRFPFVAFRQKSRAIVYWGRTPTSTENAVVVEQRQGSRWRRLVTPNVDRYGIFQGRIVGARGSGPLRARLVDRRDVSLPFSLTVPKDFRFCPWGSFC